MKKWRSFIVPGVIVTIIAGLVILVVGTKPIKTERIWGEVLKVNGNYLPNDTDPSDCYIVSRFESENNMDLYASYKVFYDHFGPKDRYVFNKCWKILLLKPGDSVSAIKSTWPSGEITYELDP